MDKRQQNLKKVKESSFQTGNKRLNKSVIVGSIIATIIAFTPLFYSLHESVPTTKVWSTFLFTYDSGYWEDAQYAMWIYTGKFLPLMFLIIWFFTCRHWWYHVLLIPIIMYSFQIVHSFRAETLYIDQNQILILLPVLVLVVPSIYLIRAKMFNKINTADKTLEELEEEFMIKPKSFWGKLKQYF
ncbi:hypothetical protein [Winogradskyella pacifica]|uniref:hypothetical protein n=1 Tax=Winogradskyella pacifica TaxID=664642 RepID=UPI001C53D6DF|nr:hypothetical protein [Winogradskyella pacifica]